MKDIKTATTLLESKGFYLSNQFDGFTTLPDEYELNDASGNVVIDHLSEAQVLQLAENYKEDRNMMNWKVIETIYPSDFESPKESVIAQFDTLVLAEDFYRLGNSKRNKGAIQN